jgi:hypothetical protein
MELLGLKHTNNRICIAVIRFLRLIWPGHRHIFPQFFSPGLKRTAYYLGVKNGILPFLKQISHSWNRTNLSTCSVLPKREISTFHNPELVKPFTSHCHIIVFKGIPNNYIPGKY